MDTITKKEIEFLLYVNASEESYLKDVTLDIGSWNCDKSIVIEILRDLIHQELIGLGRLILKDFVDLQKEMALEIITSWEIMQSSMLILFLTESGWERYNSNTYDWGISPEREKQLVFSNKGRLKS
jgi:hypothetical protein